MAAKEISDGVEDLIAIVLRGEGAHPVLRSVFGRKHVMKIIKIPEDVKGLTIKELNIPEDLEVVYVRRDDELFFPPIKEKFTLKGGDILLLNGKAGDIERIEKLILKG